MRNYARKRYDGGPVPRHIWLGVKVEDAAHTSRIEHLKQINSDARFISFKPLLGPIGDVDLRGVAWATRLVTVAIANKTARTAWAMLVRQEDYRAAAMAPR